MPSLTVTEAADNIRDEHGEYMWIILHVSGFYDWVIRAGRIVGIHLFPLLETDVASFRELNLSYVLATDGEVVIWFTPIYSGETLCVQDFNAHLAVSGAGELVLVASLWNVGDSIIADTSKALQATKSR